MDKRLRKELKKLLKKQKSFIFSAMHSLKLDNAEFIDLLHPNYYYDFLKNLDNDELVKVMRSSQMCGNNIERLFAEIPANFWIDRTSQNLKIWDTIPEEKWKKILNNEHISFNSFTLIFTAKGMSRQIQEEIVYLLNEETLNEVIRYLYGDEKGKKELIGFLEWLCLENVLERDKIPEILAKMSRLSIFSLARLFETGGATLVQKILKERDLNYEEKVELCREIKREELYNVLDKAEFSFLTTLPNKELLSLIYKKLPLYDKKEFFEKMKENDLLSYLEIEVVEDYLNSLGEKEFEEFIRELFMKKHNLFKELCPKFSNGDTLELYEALLSDKNDKIRSAVKVYLDEKLSLNFAEEAVLLLITRK